MVGQKSHFNVSNILNSESTKIFALLLFNFVFESIQPITWVFMIVHLFVNDVILSINIVVCCNKYLILVCPLFSKYFFNFYIQMLFFDTSQKQLLLGFCDKNSDTNIEFEGCIPNFQDDIIYMTYISSISLN